MIVSGGFVLRLRKKHGDNWVKPGKCYHRVYFMYAQSEWANAASAHSGIMMQSSWVRPGGERRCNIDLVKAGRRGDWYLNVGGGCTLPPPSHPKPLRHAVSRIIEFNQNPPL